MGISNGFWGRQFADRPLLAIGSAVVMAVLAIVVYAAFVRVIERRPVTELARRPLTRELGVGLLGAPVSIRCAC